MVGVAVNVTLVPAVMLVADAVILNNGATLVVMVMLIAFDVAEFVVRHGALLVSTQVITLLFCKLLVV